MRFLTLLNWSFVVVLEIGVLVLSLRRGLAQRLPGFVGYACALVANELITLCVYRIYGLNSEAYFYCYWILQALLFSLRAVVVYEICRAILSPFVGVWNLTKPALLAIGVVLAAIAGLSAQHGRYFFTTAVLNGQAGLELAVVCLLIAGLGFCAYYSVQVKKHLTWMALGFGFYSIIRAADNVLLQHWSTPWLSHFAVWNAVQHSAFDVALLMWIWALREPLPAKRPAPVLLPGDKYQVVSPLISLRLRELNNRLLEMWK